MGVKKTRRVSKDTKKEKKGKVSTIPELRRAFEDIDTFVKSKNPTAEEFQKKWKLIFGKEVSKDSAEDYLSFANQSSGVKAQRGVYTSQRGGAAPLSYDMRAGVDIPYGQFPPYVSSGFGAVVPQDSFSTSYQAGAADPSPAQATFLKGGARKTRKGRKSQKGGGILSTVAEALTRPFAASSPPSITQIGQMGAKGVDISVSGDPTINSLLRVPQAGISYEMRTLGV